MLAPSLASFSFFFVRLPQTTLGFFDSLSHRFAFDPCACMPAVSFLCLRQVEPKSGAGRAGVRVGWIVTAINDFGVASEGDLKRALAAARLNGQTSLSFTFSKVASVSMGGKRCPSSSSSSRVL